MIGLGGLELDLTITMGNVIEIGVIAVGGAIALSKFSTRFALLHSDLSGVKVDVTDMKLDIKKVNEILAKTNENDRRIGRIEDVVYGLQRGDGYVTGHGRHNVDGQYPEPT